MTTTQLNPERSEPRWLWPAAAYIHVPFCAHHCGYCDFAVAVGRDETINGNLTDWVRHHDRYDNAGSSCHIG